MHLGSNNRSAGGVVGAIATPFSVSTPTMRHAANRARPSVTRVAPSSGRTAALEDEVASLQRQLANTRAKLKEKADAANRYKAQSAKRLSNAQTKAAQAKKCKVSLTKLKALVAKKKG